jgi:HEAT repeat protein
VDQTTTTSPASSEFQTILTGLSRGYVPIGELPAESEEFWLFLFGRAGHPGRLGRRSGTATAAERLLHRPLRAKAETARRRAAARALLSPDRAARRQAIRYLRETTVTTETLEAAARAIHDRDPEVRVEAVRLLASHPSPQVMPALLDVLRTAFDVRETLAAEALVELGGAAVPGLTGLLDHDDARIRWRGTLCLAKIATPETRRGLLKALHDDSPDVAWVAADGLLALGSDATVDVLRSILAERLTSGTSRALHHYAEHAAPARVFRPLVAATAGSGVGESTLTAVAQALDTLERRV